MGDTKRRRSDCAAVFVIPELSLLNRDDAFHVQGKVRSAMIGILARFDLGERNGDGLTRVHFHVTR